MGAYQYGGGWLPAGQVDDRFGPVQHTIQTGVNVDGSVDLGGARTALINTSATVVSQINSTAGVGVPIFLRAWEGPVTFAEAAGRNVKTLTVGNFVVAWGQLICFVRFDLDAGWVYVSRTG